MRQGGRLCRHSWCIAVKYSGSGYHYCCQLFQCGEHGIHLTAAVTRVIWSVMALFPKKVSHLHPRTLTVFGSATCFG
jgi:hypothetical protein